MFRSWGDHCNYNASNVVLHVGGNYSQNQNHGLFYMNDNTATNKNANIGSLFPCTRADNPLTYENNCLSQQFSVYRALDVAHLLVKIMSIGTGLVLPVMGEGNLRRQQGDPYEKSWESVSEAYLG